MISEDPLPTLLFFLLSFSVPLFRPSVAASRLPMFCIHLDILYVDSKYVEHMFFYISILLFSDCGGASQFPILFVKLIFFPPFLTKGGKKKVKKLKKKSPQIWS